MYLVTLTEFPVPVTEKLVIFMEYKGSFTEELVSLTTFLFFSFFFEILCGNGILCFIRHCCFLSRFLLYNDVFSESVFYTLISSWLNRIFMVRSSFHGILWISPINHKTRFKKNMLSPKSSFHFFFGFVFFNRVDVRENKMSNEKWKIQRHRQHWTQDDV